ncbi:glycosyltransferase family 2 protein [Plastorhodobacter daqingensis]|uniref:Glycosyltransferase family 2 protein n=1 Tax=Plastorhodobacter daqingensis TaxID=1387281 RepID=A0ABW2UNP3_9RHOB
MTNEMVSAGAPAQQSIWLSDFHTKSEGVGFVEKSPLQTLVFVRRARPILLVTFDNLTKAGDTSEDREPWAYSFARDHGLSHLGVMTHAANWYRDAALLARFEKLAADGFFAGHERVVFAGVSMGAFAALSFAALVPGAHVIAINPQSTLDETLVPWEDRFPQGRSQDWTLPLSDAAAVTAGHGQVSIFYDPYHVPDQRHVSRFSGKNIRLFNCRHSGNKTQGFLRRAGILEPLMERMIFGELTEAEFYRLYRNRRSLPWLRNVLAGHFRAKGRDEMAARIRALRLPRQGAAGAVAAAPAVLRDRSGQKNDRRLMITTMKNEGPFMLEWVAYNRSIGFTDFLIYTNDCADGTDHMASRLQELGVAVHQENPAKAEQSPHRVALNHAIRHPLYRTADWAINADCDEFLNIRAGDGTLDDLFEACGPADAISLCWKMFGCGGIETYEDRFISRQFTWAAPEIGFTSQRASGFKTLFRPDSGVNKLGVHRPRFGEDAQDVLWKDAGGKQMPQRYIADGWSAPRDFSHSHARLHHYAVRSIDSFLVKRDRGRANHFRQDQGLDYWIDMNLNVEIDETILSRLPRAEAEFARLLKDPVLADLHAAAVAWHRSRIEDLNAREGWPEFRAAIRAINPPGEMPAPRTNDRAAG